MDKLWVTLAPDLKTLRRLSQERSCNDDLFYLLCPFVYLYYLGIPIDPLNLVFINIAIAAMHLQGLISAFHSYLTEGKFSRRILYVYLFLGKLEIHALLFMSWSSTPGHPHWPQLV